jgi:hypothetical protein
VEVPVISQNISMEVKWKSLWPRLEATVTLRVRVSGPGVIQWDSASFTQVLGGGILPPENMVNFVGFSLVALGNCPEPSTVALGILGAVALVALRKRK